MADNDTLLKAILQNNADVNELKGLVRAHNDAVMKELVDVKKNIHSNTQRILILEQFKTRMITIISMVSAAAACVGAIITASWSYLMKWIGVE